MKQIISIIFLLYGTVSGALGQEGLKEIVSFTYHLSYDDAVWYIIEPCFKYDNGVIKCEKDSILSIDVRLSDVFPFTYEIDNGWFIGKRCFRHNNLEKCNVDSILIYTPFKYFSDENKPNKEDTLSVVDYSALLHKLGEPKIFGTNTENDILRFILISKYEVDIFRLSKKQEVISMNYKNIMLTEDMKVTNDTTCVISLKAYYKLIKKLHKGNYWELNKSVAISPRNILIETLLNGQYYFLNKNSKEIELENKELLKIFPFLKRLIKS